MTDYTHTTPTKIAAIAAMILALAISLNVRAAEVTTQHSLTLDAARTVIAAAEAEALQKGWPCVIAVTDSAGYLITLDRMDASPMLASVELTSWKDCPSTFGTVACAGPNTTTGPANGSAT